MKKRSVFNLFESFQFHDFLNFLSIAKYRYSLIKHRLSSPRLAIETAMRNKPHPIHFIERICRNFTSVEDEFHFLFECTLYGTLR